MPTWSGCAAVWNGVARPSEPAAQDLVLPHHGLRWATAVYFERGDADSYAAALREEHWEVSVYGVPAYSSLGLPGDWMAGDPLLNTFIQA